MERRFDMGDFEQALKDHADQFNMLPSKRVWNGIYNNLHPGSRWPSITIAVILMLTLITVGNLNNSPKTFLNSTQKGSSMDLNKIDSKKDEANKISLEDIQSKKSVQGIASIPIKNLIEKAPVKGEATSGSDNATLFNTTNATSANSLNVSRLKSKPAEVKNRKSQLSVQDSKKIIGGNSITFINSNYGKSTRRQQSDMSLNTLKEDIFNTNNTRLLLSSSFVNDVAKTNYVIDYLQPIKNSNIVLAFAPEKYLFLNDPVRDISIEADNKTETNTEKINVKKEGNTSANKKVAHIHKKRNTKIEWQYYVTPLISTATFRGRPLHSNADPGLSPIVVMSNEPLRNREYNARMGLETGVQMSYKLLKKLAFVTGVNFSYSGYKVMSYPIHPTSASLILQDENTEMIYSRRYVARFGNGTTQNQKPLSNYSYQVSIPLGLQYTVWGNKDMQVNLLSSFSPTAILKSDAFIMSSDSKYYVQDPSLLRPVNVNGSFEPTITFISPKVKWHVGPEIRYQLLSTYKNSFSIKEHLINYGIKIGISR